MTSSLRVLLDETEIARITERVGTEIAADHPNGLVLVGVLKGALPFMADLARAVDRPVEIDFLALSRFAPDSGRVRILQDLSVDVAGRDVVLVDGLVDTGLTLAYLRRHLEARAPARISVAALLDRATKRIVPQTIDYCGVEVGDEWLLGYGFTYDERYRNLPNVYAGRRDEVAADPDCYLGDAYGR